MKTLNDYAVEAHQANLKWWQDPTTQEPIKRDQRELIALIHSELSEALEGFRKDLMDDKLPHRKMAEVELADAIIRIFDFCGGFGIQFSGEPFESLSTRGAMSWKAMQQYDAAAEQLSSPSVAIYYLHGLASMMLSPSGPLVYADALIALISMLCALAHKEGFDLEAAYREKMEYNRTRHDHTHAARLAAGGKKF